MEVGEEVGQGEEGKRGIIYLSLHCHHQNDFCITMGSDESHFNVSLTVRDKVTRHCPQTTTFEEKGKPKRIRTEVSLLTRGTLFGNRPVHRTLHVISMPLLLHSTVGYNDMADSNPQ